MVIKWWTCLAEIHSWGVLFKLPDLLKQGMINPGVHVKNRRWTKIQPRQVRDVRTQYIQVFEERDLVWAEQQAGDRQPDWVGEALPVCDPEEEGRKFMWGCSEFVIRREESRQFGPDWLRDPEAEQQGYPGRQSQNGIRQARLRRQNKSVNGRATDNSNEMLDYS